MVVELAGRETHVDGRDHDVGDEVDVLEVARFEIEESVDPDCGDRSVMDGEDGALFVVRGTAVEKLRVPVLTGPGTFAFRAEEWRGLFVGQVNDDVEGGLRAKKLVCRGRQTGRVRMNQSRLLRRWQRR